MLVLLMTLVLEHGLSCVHEMEILGPLDAGYTYTANRPGERETASRLPALLCIASDHVQQPRGCCLTAPTFTNATAQITEHVRLHCPMKRS